LLQLFSHDGAGVAWCVLSKSESQEVWGSKTLVVLVVAGCEPDLGTAVAEAIALWFVVFDCKRKIKKKRSKSLREVQDIFFFFGGPPWRFVARKSRTNALQRAPSGLTEKLPEAAREAPEVGRLW
jgi:hypothetical protein